MTPIRFYLERLIMDHHEELEVGLSMYDHRC